MNHDNRKPPFRADHVGSMIRSPELIEAREAFEQGALNRAAIREIEDAAIRDTVAMQERVGLQSITDGELRRFNWRDGFFESVDGFSETRVQSSFSFTEFDGEVRRGTPVPVVERRRRVFCAV